MATFKKATKKQSKLRIALEGPAGSGKTYTALAIATALCPDGLIAVLDTERGSASLYAGDPFDFVTAEMVGDYHPDRFIKAIKAAEADGVDVLIIDSITHEWKGTGGCLDLHERATQADRNKNSYTAWAKITPLHDAFLDAINASSMHIIATMRSKTEYILQENSRGKKVPTRVGMGAEMRKGSEYEFDIIGELDMDNTLVIVKSRCHALSGGVFRKAGGDVAEVIRQWLKAGDPTPVDDITPIEHTHTPPAPAQPASHPALDALKQADLGEVGAGETPSPENTDTDRALFAAFLPNFLAGLSIKVFNAYPDKYPGSKAKELVAQYVRSGDIVSDMTMSAAFDIVQSNLEGDDTSPKAPPLQ